MMEEGTVGMTTHYHPLRQQRRTNNNNNNNNNNKTHLLDATISHDEMLITMTTNPYLLRTTETQ